MRAIKVFDSRLPQAPRAGPRITFQTELAVTVSR